MRLILPLLATALVLAGCAAPAADVDDPSTDPRDGTAPRGPAHDHSTHAHGDGWAEEADAPIRPGIQVVSPTGQCTSNFVFSGPNNVSLYLGLAAHCVDGMAVGDEVDIGGVATGTLAYSSWITMADVAEKDADALEFNDFALILLPDDARALVHPAMRHFGGPIGIADSASVASGDKILTYGNSGLRGETDPASWHEGYVVQTSAWSTTVYTATPGIPGDSGSGAMTGDGRALGIVVTLTIAPLVGSNGITHLDMALAYAAEHAGLDVTLATWELEDGGVLPAP